MYLRSTHMRELQLKFFRRNRLSCLCRIFCNKVCLSDIASMFTYLRELTLSCGDRWKIKESSLLAVLRNNPYLQMLSMSGCANLSDMLVMSIAEYCVHLKKLNVGYCPLVSDESILLIAAKCVGLNSLYVRNCPRVTSVSIAVVIAECKFLTSLTVNGSGVDETLRVEITEKYGLF